MERYYDETSLIPQIINNDDILQVCKGYLNHDTQRVLAEQIRNILKVTPLFQPTMKDGTPFKYQMSNCGLYGWLADKSGYRYDVQHPNGLVWRDMPDTVKIICRILVPYLRPETCLINVYKEGQSLGLHRDESEKSDAPIVSISLGASALFYLGGALRSDPISKTILLRSGDILIMSGKYRHFYHKVGSPEKDGPAFMKDAGVRVNLTIRQVYK
jgi:alkylated DNA repair protein (DNA oxidative demethylase)